AGSFYPAEPAACRREAAKLIAAAKLPADLPKRICGGIVPHAGWAYSGRLSALTLKALAAGGEYDTLVIFGADHWGAAKVGEVFDSGLWQTPLGNVAVDERVAKAIVGAADCLRANPGCHAREHAIEVQVPLVKLILPKAKIVPITVPASEVAVQIGRAVGKVLAAKFPSAAVVGSTDLSHHGGHFPAPGGRGEAGMLWAEKNDRRMLDLIEALAAEKVIGEYKKRANACGPGAVAATLAACRILGAKRGRCLAYTNSYRVLRRMAPSITDDTTVGYASVIFPAGRGSASPSDKRTDP
ncbi:MAG: AmmeMemoRadiSam system protein B, partial [Phycisphaerae bacterium]